mmetsp:Transcript_18890/g.34188  ORF Transcript_18890/g.34188 Transcript_18890/m.34188 type:complete len:223 (+) Transcript_18890:726-1394(+)
MEPCSDVLVITEQMVKLRLRGILEEDDGSTGAPKLSPPSSTQSSALSASEGSSSEPLMSETRSRVSSWTIWVVSMAGGFTSSSPPSSSSILSASALSARLASCSTSLFAMVSLIGNGVTVASSTSVPGSEAAVVVASRSTSGSTSCSPFIESLSQMNEAFESADSSVLPRLFLPSPNSETLPAETLPSSIPSPAEAAGATTTFNGLKLPAMLDDPLGRDTDL